MSGFQNISQTLGLHPLVGFGMVAVDLMLFGGEAATVGVTWAVSVPVALALAIPCVLLQRYSYGDSWGVAVGKGALIGLLTAIPTPLPALVSLVGGGLGLARMLGKNSPAPRQLDEPLPEDEQPGRQVVINDRRQN
ncbi:MAG TPA: hypothetical protein VFS21_25340 [Roseiflexaceae bacterium]|nr:hypothetical protein [Roseiflexaceae bacterium]